MALKMYLLSLIRLHLKALKLYVSFVFKIPLFIYGKETLEYLAHAG